MRPLLANPDGYWKIRYLSVEPIFLVAKTTTKPAYASAIDKKKERSRSDSVESVAAAEITAPQAVLKPRQIVRNADHWREKFCRRDEIPARATSLDTARAEWVICR